jgi:hypothetical protein
MNHKESLSKLLDMLKDNSKKGKLSGLFHVTPFIFPSDVITDIDG